MQDAGLLLMRGVLGTVFVFHGSQKLFGWFGGYGLQATAQWMESLGIPFGLVSAASAGSIEFFGGLLLFTGVATRLVSVPMAITMIVAAATTHNGFDVTQGGNEYPITMAVVLAGLGLIGPGRWTLPEAISRARNARSIQMNQIASVTTVALLVLGLVPAGINAQHKGDTMTTQDQAEITTLLNRYESALNASDVDAVLELYASDGVFMPSSAPTAEGADQVRASYEFVFSTIQLAIRFSIDEIEVHGDLAFARTGSKGTVTILADGSSAPEENRELFVLEKHRGEWKIARYMFNKTS